jgi:hypothetical protein
MTTYRALLLAPDGSDYVTDFSRSTKEEVAEAVADMGSRWFFYPIVVTVADSGRRIVDGFECFGDGWGINTAEWIGCSIKRLRDDLANTIGKEN